MTAAPVTFPTWVPRAWREAFSPGLVGLFGPRPDLTLPHTYHADLVRRKVVDVVRYGRRSDDPVDSGGWRLARRLPEAIGIRFEPRRDRPGFFRGSEGVYVLTCPACGQSATTLIVLARGEPPFCQFCVPRRLPVMVSCLARLNFAAQLRLPEPFIRQTLRRTLRLLDEALDAGDLRDLLPALTSPVLGLFPPRRERPKHVGPLRRLPGQLELLVAGLHPVHFLLADALWMREGLAGLSAGLSPVGLSGRTRARDSRSRRVLAATG